MEFFIALLCQRPIRRKMWIRSIFINDRERIVRLRWLPVYMQNGVICPRRRGYKSKMREREKIVEASRLCLVNADQNIAVPKTLAQLWSVHKIGGVLGDALV